MMRLCFAGAVALTLGAAGLPGIHAQEPAAPASACAQLAALALPDTTITNAEAVVGGTFTPPRGRALDNLPPFCRVAATSKPAVRFEVWLPLNAWNQKFQGVGNGANAGSISYEAMATALRRGYATASTDTGHATTNARDASWALGRPDLMEDFAHRALHLTTVHGKAIVQTFYSRPAVKSYYVGCSTGGRQGLMEAQRYPDDYDGLVAGAPAANWTRFQTAGHLWAVIATNKDPESYVPSSKLPIIEGAVMAVCDGKDGLTDGILTDPRQCTFDATRLACAAGQDPATCLTAKQAAAVNNIWNGARNSRGELVYPPYMRGAEAAGGWANYTTGSGPMSGNHWEQAENTLKYMVFENPAWDSRTFDYDRDVAFADRKLGALMNAFDPDLSRLRARGGKLLLYHGWNDPSISPLNTVNYYESAVTTWRAQEKRSASDGTQPDFIRLFMVPGMLHCSGGPGADTFDAVGALERWVEQGIAPDSLPAAHRTKGLVEFERPLCAYPAIPTYDGTGDPKRSSSFSCKTQR
jgi:feruloyl esterase